MSREIGQFKELFYSELSFLYPKHELDGIYRIVLEEQFDKGIMELRLRGNFIVDDITWQNLVDWLGRLKRGEPIQHVTTKGHFYGRDFYVNSKVLVPRQETEELVQHVIEWSKTRDSLSILDIGTGSGCIAISLAAGIANCKVTGMDISEGALEIATLNANKYGADINFITEDIFNPVLVQNMRFDIIVSNPPYVTEAEKPLMHKNVLEYDPHLALFVPDSNPLIYYKAIAEFAVMGLKRGGLLALEINESFAAETSAIFIETEFCNLQVHADLFGKKRFVTAIKA